MKKKLLALLCVLSVLVGVFALSATAATTTSEDVFYVGYAKVDINPYYTDGDPTSGIMPVPLRGTGSSATRLAYGYKVDDNGDGNTDENDGLFLTCIAISNTPDSYEDAILLFTMDAIGDMGHTSLARKTIQAELGIAGDHIMVSGTHAHSGVDLTTLTKSLYLDTVADVAVVDTNGVTQYVDGQTAHEYLNEWRTRLTGYHKNVVTDDAGEITTYKDEYTNTNNYFVQAAQAALDDRAVAVISKGQIEADESGITNADNMNFVRNYVSLAKDGTSFVRDAHFNTAITGSTVKGHVSDADQTLHAITFDFDDSTKDPIVLVNWRNHPQFVSTANNYVVSSDYINAFRYQMGLEANGGYRAAFFQGTGGNTQPYGMMTGEGWANNELVTDAHTYGKLLADVTKVCLTKNMQQVDEGKIQTQQNIYEANRVTFTWDVPAVVEAANAANAWPYKYTYTDESGVVQTDWIINAAHASRLLTHYNTQGTKMTMEIDTIMIGPEIAIVTCPGEPFDRYSLQAAEDLKAKFDADQTVTYTDYMNIANSYNDWEKLNTYNSTTKLGIKNAQYGEPLIFGYSNQHVTYIPNALTYNYNANISETYATQSYENYMTPLAEGEGERMVANLATMLDEMVNGVTAPCEYCGVEDAFWYPLNNSGIIDEYDHYYLSGDMNTSQLSVSEGRTICLDLMGKTLSNTANSGTARAFTVQDNAILNIQDTHSADTENGQIVGTCTGSGGAICTNPGSTVNIYGGTISATTAPSYGGAIWAKGTVNIYGGKIVAGNAKYTGDAICLHNSKAALNVYGGEITKNTSGDCVGFRVDSGDSVENVLIKVGGDAVIGEITYLNGPTADTFQIVATDNSPAFTGSVMLNAKGITDGAVIGSFTAQWSADTEVTISDGTEVCLSKDNTLVAQRTITKAAAVVNGTLVTEYDTLAQAIANVGTGYVILGADVADLTVSSDITVDLNGKTVTNATATNKATLKFRDRKTEDYSIADNIYGVVVNTSGNVVAADSFVAVTDDATGTSYHGYSMALKSVTLRPSANGLYYKSEFLGDSMVYHKIESFGVALNLSEEPTETNMKPGTYSAFAPEDFGGENNSTVLVNIMKSANSVATNTTNAQTPVYGRAYIKFTDGSYEFTESEYYSLQELTETISKDYWTQLDDTQKDDLVEMYRKFSAVMGSWDIANIKTEYATRVAQQQQEEDETLKVIILGSSYSIDSYHLLGEVINAEGIPEGFTYNGNTIKNVDLAIMYKSGCYMYQHADYAKNNTAAYTYYKTSYRSDSTYTSGWTSKSKTTLKEALTDEKWDIVVLQESNMDKGIVYDYHTSDTKYVANYVKRTLGYTPEFMWNMTWANPEVPTIDGVAGEDEWIYELANPGAESWETRMQDYYGNDAQTQHNKMVSYVQKYITGHYGITEDNVVTCGTAVMYALNNLTLATPEGDDTQYVANEKFSYRDYCHLSDVSRVMVSYLWYAKLFDLDQIDAVNYTEIPYEMQQVKTADKTALDISAYTDNIKKAVNYTLANPFGQYTGE